MKIQISGHVVPVSHTHKQLSIIQTNQSSVHNNKQGIKNSNCLQISWSVSVNVVGRFLIGYGKPTKYTQAGSGYSNGNNFK